MRCNANLRKLVEVSKTSVFSREWKAPEESATGGTVKLTRRDRIMSKLTEVSCESVPWSRRAIYTKERMRNFGDDET